jgi:hypothetical protein
MPFKVKAIKRPQSIGFQLESGIIVGFDEWVTVDTITDYDKSSGKILWQEVKPVVKPEPVEQVEVKQPEPEAKPQPQPKKKK